MDLLDVRLFAQTDPLRLAGSTCTDCGTTTFPSQRDCPRCASPTMESRALPETGTLWTWTLQCFEPKAPYVPDPGGFTPYPVGYVDLGPVLVEAVLAADPAELRTGAAMHLVPLSVRIDAGQNAIGFAFAPSKDKS